MLTSSVIQKTISTKSPLRTDPSRCFPMRFRGHCCHACARHCRHDAISFEPSLTVHHARCSACMLCAACCPSEAIVAHEVNFLTLLARLQQIPRPVLACRHYPDVHAHETTACLGWLGEEALIALGVKLPSSLQLNLLRCRDCHNGFIVEALKRNLDMASAKTGIDLAEKIICVEDIALLDYQERVRNRRDFFGAFKHRLVREVVEVLDAGSPPRKESAYNSKQLPVKRVLLNDALSRVSGAIGENILTNYYYASIIQERCDACAVCVAVCPTGALAIQEKQPAGNDLIFDVSRCHGCKLCTIACRKNAIRIEGFYGKVGD